MPKRSGLRTIEANWTGPMANNVNTRVRFAMWDAMKLAAALAGGNGGRTILKALQRDQSLFDENGHERKPRETALELAGRGRAEG